MPPTRKRSLRWLPFWAAFAAALLIRLVLLDARPLHHDEGVAAWVVGDLLEGYRYTYDPARFHGPFLAFITLPFIAFFRESVLALRLPAALASALMIPLLLPLRRRLGLAGITASAWLLALSPSFVAYGRDLIHETFLVTLTLALIASICSWLETRRESHFILAALSLGLLATVKETYAITLATMAFAAILTWGWIGRPAFFTELASGLSRRAQARATASFAVPYVLLYTWFFTNPRGLLDSFRSFSIWAGKGIAGSGHGKTWDYFLQILPSFEAVIGVCAVAGGCLALRRRDAFGTFCALWAVGELAVYSAIRYKTPWLVLNVLLPPVLAAGVLYREVFERPASRALRALLAAALALGLSWSAWRAIEVSFLRFDDDRLALVYVPTHRDVDDLLAWVEASVRQAPSDRQPSIRIYGRNDWPLPWYLKRLGKVDYRHDIPSAPDGDVLIVERTWEARLRPLLRNRYQRQEYVLRPREWVAVYVRADLESPMPHR